jgi:hypothetical protein
MYLNVLQTIEKFLRSKRHFLCSIDISHLIVVVVVKDSKSVNKS